MKRKEFILIAVILFTSFAVITIVKRWRHSDSNVSSNIAVKADSIQTFWTFYNKATQYGLQGEADSSIITYQKALKLNPNHEEALYYLGSMYMKADQFEKAKETWEKLTKLNQQSERAFYQLGNLFFCINHPDFFDVENAKMYFIRANELNKESLNPNLRLGEIALFQNRANDAFDIISKLIDHKNEEIYFIKGYLNWKLGKTKAAISDLQRTIELKGLELKYDEAGKAISAENKTAENNQDCSLFKYWVTMKLELPGKYDISIEMPKVYRKFDQYLILMRGQLNHD